MRLLTLAIAVFALVGVAYLNLKSPASATLYNDDMKVASVQPAH